MDVWTLADELAWAARRDRGDPGFKKRRDQLKYAEVLEPRKEFCYLAVIKPSWRAEVSKQLGPEPLASMFLYVPEEAWHYESVERARLVSVGLGRLHVAFEEHANTALRKKLWAIALPMGGYKTRGAWRRFLLSLGLRRIGAAVGPDKMINKALNENATDLAAPEAGKRFNSTLKASLRVSPILTAMEQRQFLQIVGKDVLFDMSRAVTNDHPGLVACRELAVQEMDAAIARTSGRFTTLGSGAFEIRKFGADERFDIHFAMKEGKDVARTLGAIVNEAKRRFNKTLTPKQRSVLAADIKNNQIGEGAVSKKRARFSELLEWCNENQTWTDVEDRKNPPARLLYGDYQQGDSSTLLAYDCIYNMGWKGIAKALKETGAYQMYASAFMPDELIWGEDMPEHPWYVTRKVQSLSQKAKSSFTNSGLVGAVANAVGYEQDAIFQVGFTGKSGGHCGGYQHDWKTWKSVMEFPQFIDSVGACFDSEIVASFGPMKVFRFWRTASITPSVRVLSLPEHARFVRILDPMASADEKGRLTNLKYVAVPQFAFEGLLAYLSTLPDVQLTPINAMAYCHRHCNGIVMGSDVKENPWNVDTETRYKMAVIASALVAGMRQEVAEVEKASGGFKKKIDRWTKFMGMLKKIALVGATIGIAWAAIKIWEWFVEDDVAGLLVLTPEFTHWQEGLTRSDLSKFSFTDIEITVDHEEIFGDCSKDTHPILDKLTEEVSEIKEGELMPIPGAGEIRGDSPACYYCNQIRGKLGAQIVRCTHQNDTKLDWSMTREEVVKFKNEMITAANPSDPNVRVPEPLRKAIVKAYECFVDGDWNLPDIETILVEAGPGCGKSYAIRAGYTNRTLVMAAFGKLRADYMQVLLAGERIDMNFKTTHKAMYDTGAYDTIVVDEFTAMDRRAVSAVLRKTGAKRVILVGDRRQTGIRAEEGENILTWNDLKGVDLHELLVYFRGTSWTCALLNKFYGYDMIAARHDPTPFALKSHTAYANEASERASINFSHATADTFYGEGNSNSVRANQGSTYENVALVVGDGDGLLIANQPIFRVAISRHSKTLSIFYDPASPVVGALHAALHTDDILWSEDVQERETEVLRLVGREKATAVHVAEAKTERALAEVQLTTDRLLYARKMFDLDGRVGETELSNVPAFDALEREMTKVVEGVVFPDISEDALWAQSMPGLGPIAEGARRMAAGVSVLSEEQSFVAWYHNISWCSLVAVLRWANGDAEIGMAYLLHLYQRWRLSGCDEFGGSWAHLKSFFTELGLPLIYVEINDGRWRFSGDIPKTLLAGQEKNIVVMVKEPGHVRYDVGIEKVILRDDAIMKLTMRSGRGAGVTKTIKDMSLLRYLINGALVDSGIDEVETGAHKLHKAVIATPAGFYFESGVLTGQRPEEHDVREKNWLERFDLGPDLPTTLAVENFTPMTVLSEGGPMAPVPELRPAFDSYTFLPEVDYQDGRDFLRAANEIESAYAVEDLRVRKIQISPEFIDPIETKKNKSGVITRAPAKEQNPRLAIDRGSGNRFAGGVAARVQCVHSLGHRYNKPGRPSYESQPLTEQAKRVARAVCDQFVEDCMYPELRTDPQAEAIAWHGGASDKKGWRSAVRSKNYMGRAEANHEADLEQAKVEYFCKDQDKVAKNGYVNPTKAGQGISAWAPGDVASTGGFVRLLNQRFEMNLLPGIIYDNLKTEEELSRQVLDAVGALPYGVKSYTTDVAEMDAMQDAFTQYLEQLMIERLGFSGLWVQKYYERRRDYKIIARGVAMATGTTEKTSGEPGTLLFNSVLSAMLSNYILRGRGEFAMVIKGDDNNKWQLGLHVDEGRYAQLKAVCRYRMVAFTGQAEFCGKVVNPDGMYTSTERMVSKIVMKAMKTAQHFYDVQAAIRDRIRLVSAAGTEKTLAATAKVHGISYEQARSNYDALISFSHLKLTQYEQVAKPLKAISGQLAMIDGFGTA